MSRQTSPESGWQFLNALPVAESWALKKESTAQRSHVRPARRTAAARSDSVILDRHWLKSTAGRSHDAVRSQSFDRCQPPLLWFPIIRSCVPKDTVGLPDEVVVAEASYSQARHSSGSLRFLVLPDPMGTVTPSQFVDRLGGLLVKSSFRPAQRLILFGGFLLIIEGTLRLLALAYGEAAKEAAQTVADPGVLEAVRDFLKRFVGTTLLVSGSVCFFILAIGWWMQRSLARPPSFTRSRCSLSFCC